MTGAHFTAGLRPDRAVIRIEGPDARHFLHNLLTADIEHLPDGGARYAALLTPQGKILFDVFVFDAGGVIHIDCAAAQKSDLLKRFALYKLRAQVTISDQPGLAAMVSSTSGTWADPRYAAMGFRSIVPSGSAPVSDDYDAARIALGLADSVADIGSGVLFPHEANLDQLGGVSFTKGCYVGQEVVSRMEHRGTARSRILPLKLSGPAPAKGSLIRSGDKTVGEVLSSRGMRALGLLRLDRLADAEVPLLTGDVSATVVKPRWVRYEVPKAEVEA